MSSKPKNFSNVDFLFVLSIVVFFVLMLQTFKSSEEVAKGRELEERTYHIMGKLDRLLSHTLEVETGNRGYAISGNENFLESFQKGKIYVMSTIDTLRHLIIDPEQSQRLDTLDLLIREKLAISENIISMVKTQGMVYTVNYISQGEGQRIMDSIQGVIGRAANKELILLSARSTATEEKRYARGLYFIILSITALLVMIVAYILVRRSMKSLLQNKEVQEDLINELSYQNKQLDDFAHITSHNIRGPANNISALVAMVNVNSPASEFKLIFSKIEKVSKNLVETLNELLEVLHVKKNKEVEKTKLSFQQIFLKEKENLEGEILKTSAEIYYDFSSAPSVEYPKAYLESICHNLLGNALKYRSPDRTPVIQVKTEQKDSQVLLHVSDNGLGIDLDRFGDKLFGLRKTFHDHPDARGIGLFMTKAQIEALGGKIFVQSKVGEGTTFTVRF